MNMQSMMGTLTKTTRTPAFSAGKSAHISPGTQHNGYDLTVFYTVFISLVYIACSVFGKVSTYIQHE